MITGLYRGLKALTPAGFWYRYCVLNINPSPKILLYYGVMGEKYTQSLNNLFIIVSGGKKKLNTRTSSDSFRTVSQR